MGRNWNFFSFDLRDWLSRDFPLPFGESRLTFGGWDDKRERRRCFAFADFLSFHSSQQMMPTLSQAMKAQVQRKMLVHNY
jgi:hypothetical protein